MAISVLVGEAIGKGNIQLVKKVSYIGIFISTLFVLIMTLPILLYLDVKIIAIFTDDLYIK